jgi:hypothetical protein
VKLALKYKSRPKIAEGFILRNLDTRTDARLDTLLEAREAESSHARTLFTPDATGMPEGGERRRIRRSTGGKERNACDGKVPNGSNAGSVNPVNHP